MRSRPIGAFLCACILLCLTQTSVSDTRPLPQDTGALHLAQLLAKLKTTARLMQAVAHPDDEDGGTLTLESRGKGATVMLFTVTRGEGGQNKFGAESADDLGILRTLELLQAGKYYNVEQRFSHVVDFGFSKTADETFSKWHGHDLALADLVRVIRTFKPDVLTAGFSGTKRDGHGNHEASGVLTLEAFRAAGDPNRFPEQIKEGLLPWQAKKLYMGNPPRARDFTVADADYTVRIDSGEYSPILGMSYAQFGLEGLAHQTSQGTGGLRIPPGHRYRFYKLADSVLPPKAAGEHESDFFDGIDTSLVALAELVTGKEEPLRPKVREELAAIAAHVDEASKLFSLQDTTACAAPLLAGWDKTRKLLAWAYASQLPPAQKEQLVVALRTKVEQFQEAADEALGVFFEVTVDPPGGPAGPSLFPRMEQTLTMATPGQSFTVTARLYNRGKASILPQAVRLDLPQGWEGVPTSLQRVALRALSSGDVYTTQFKITVPENAPYTRPYFTRRDPQAETFYGLSNPVMTGLPFPPYPVHAIAGFGVGDATGEVETVAKVKFIDPVAGQSDRPLAVGPALSVLLDTPVVVIPTTGAGKSKIDVSVRSNVQSAVHAKLRLDAPPGWKVEPPIIPVDLDHEGDISSYSFQLSPPSLHEGTYQVKAKADFNGKEYAEGFKILTRPDLDSFYAYHPATQNVQAVDVKLAPGLKVGYIMGAGDEVFSVLKSVGVNVSLITSEELAGGDLSRYSTIVVGIRAYDVCTDLREQNRRLLEFVNRGGTLVVQNNQSVGAFNDGHFTPYPATLSSERVSVEEMPVEVLAPQERVFSYPNKITAKDFDGWVQERSVNSMSQWDEHFTPLLSSHDPGEPPQKGGMLLAHYGNGTYIYTGYAFFRQLPAGVPGAIRLFVNLLSLGQIPKVK